MADRLKRLLTIALAVAAVDQIVKAVAVHYLSSLSKVTVIPGFADLVLVYNRGAAFGSLASWPHAHWILIAVSGVALGIAAWVVLGKAGRTRAVQNCVGLVVGGALGNLIDRLRLGRVVDFVDLHVGGLHWPAFNVADAAISVAGVYLAYLLFRGKL